MSDRKPWKSWHGHCDLLLRGIWRRFTKVFDNHNPKRLSLKWKMPMGISHMKLIKWLSPNLHFHPGALMDCFMSCLRVICSWVSSKSDHLRHYCPFSHPDPHQATWHFSLCTWNLLFSKLCFYQWVPWKVSFWATVEVKPFSWSW